MESSWTMSDAEEPSPHSSTARTGGSECTTVTIVLMQELRASVKGRLITMNSACIFSPSCGAIEVCVTHYICMFGSSGQLY